MSLVVVGSANVDLFVRGQRLPEPGETVFADTYDELPGGKGLNQAVAAARAGAEVAFFCAVGKDSGADFLAGFLDTEPLTLSATVTSAPTGRAIIQVDANAENSIMVVGGANLAASSFDGKDFKSRVAEASHVILQQEVSLALNLQAAKLARDAGTLVVLTPAPAENTSNELLELVDILLLNEHEARIVAGLDDSEEAARSLSANRTVVLTQGAAGAALFSHGAPVGFVTAPKVESVDTTGAGDCLAGNFVAHRDAGADDLDALDAACRAASESVKTAGAATAMPHRAVPLPTQSAGTKDR